MFEAVAHQLLEIHPMRCSSGDFRALTLTPEDCSSFGTALGEFQRNFSGAKLEGLPLRDAAWCSRAAPYVLAEFAERVEEWGLNVSLAQLARLEEAGIIIAELSEPLSGLHSSLVHGNCTLETTGFSPQPCLRDWRFAVHGFPWLDVANLSSFLERDPECLLALVSSYANAYDCVPTVLSDLIPFIRTLGDVIMLDHWNTWVHKDARVQRLDLQLEQRVERILDLTGT
jgi:Phosphotransferase enzyme family